MTWLDKRYRMTWAIAFVPLVLAVALAAWRPVVVSSVMQPKGVGDGQVVSLDTGTKVEQTFIATTPEACAVSIVIAGGESLPHERLTVALAADQSMQGPPVAGEVLGTASVDLHDLHFWQNQVFRFPTVRLEPNKRYIVSVTSEFPVAIAAAKGDSYTEGEAYSSGARLDNDIIFRVQRQAGVTVPSALFGAANIPGPFGLALLFGMLLSTGVACRGILISDEAGE